MVVTFGVCVCTVGGQALAAGAKCLRANQRGGELGLIDLYGFFRGHLPQFIFLERGM
jgi:hypothetical protein